MKRDMDLVREILFEVESWPSDGSRSEVLIGERNPGEVEEHVRIMIAAGLLHGDELAFRQVLVDRLSWAGHDFLDAARNSETWERAKGTFAEKGIGMPFDALKSLLVKLVTDAVFGA